MSPAAAAPASAKGCRPSTPADLAGVLLVSLEALAAAGQVDEACRLAGRACAVLRESDAGTWHRFNALLHRLVRRLPREERQPPET